ncbi:hotdog fold thioesterase [Euzebya tangerina]|uniref:hotdog fold thioesterase n=1 Tax=Euzebya tangerina TaxID=591198 RepID=UPI0013C2BD5B|nr:hotdog fold thioesterase [Euzebya tangerina]
MSEIFARTPVYAVHGVRIDDWGPGWALVSLAPTSSLANLAGSLHGGISFLLADAAFEIACNSYGRMAVALEVTTHHHLPAPTEGRISADCWEITRGGRTASYRIQVRDEEDRLLSSYQALAYRTSNWHIDPAPLPEGWG